MKKYKVVITLPAERDLKDIVHYISKELLNPPSAQLFLKNISESLYSLHLLPKRHPLVKDYFLARQGIRKFSIDNYIAFYILSETDQTITVLRILHAKRNWEELL